MSEWEELLEESAKTPEQHKQEQAEAEEIAKRRILEVYVQPAFERLKEALARQGVTADFDLNNPASFMIKDGGREPFRYLVHIRSSSNVDASVLYCKYNETSFTEQPTGLTAAFLQASDPADELALNFVKNYGPLRHDL